MERTKCLEDWNFQSYLKVAKKPPEAGKSFQKEHGPTDNLDLELRASKTARGKMSAVSSHLVGGALLWHPGKLRQRLPNSRSDVGIHSVFPARNSRCICPTAMDEKDLFLQFF